MSVLVFMGLAAPAVSARPVAVVELFTSEGCSSCPPADLYLNGLAGSNPAVYPLAFHVDYWNRLGWRDPFSSAEFTERQRQYVNRLHLEGAFTPQMIVNGTVSLVGSDEKGGNAAIAAALHRPGPAALTLSHAVVRGHTVQIDYQCSGGNPQDILSIAVAEDHLRSKVSAGENSGTELVHEHVVRGFKSVQLHASGQVVLDVPSTMVVSNAAVVGFVQAQGLGQIEAGDAIPLASR